MYSIVKWCAKSSYIEEVPGRTDTLGQEILKTQDQGLQDVYDLNQASSPFSPRLRMRYQLTLQELNTSF